VKSLETEVTQLRANEANLHRETKGLYSVISMLKNLLISNGIEVPDYADVRDKTISPVERVDSSPDSIIFIAKTSAKGPPQRIHVKKPNKNTVVPGMDVYLSESSNDSSVKRGKRQQHPQEWESPPSEALSRMLFIHILLSTSTLLTR
jgi:hypothetical protein